MAESAPEEDDVALTPGTLVVRTDGNGRIGFGHVMRCSAIARQAKALGCDVVFAVSERQSAGIVRDLGLDTCVIGESGSDFHEDDAVELGELVRAVGASCVIVDSYSATPDYLSWAHAVCHDAGALLAYMDDAYRYDSGYLRYPTPYDVDAVINYSFGCSAEEYESAYRTLAVSLLIGPRYAPVREEFLDKEYLVGNQVHRVLVTAGSMNIDGSLERMVCACLKAAPGAEIVVIVGPGASFDRGGRCRGSGGARVKEVRAPSDVPALMTSVDLAVSAGGATLYELAAIGVPTVAVPVVENQLANIRGWSRLGLGPVLDSVEWEEIDLVDAVGSLTGDSCMRAGISTRLRKLVDGQGARRVVERLRHVREECYLI